MWTRSIQADYVVRYCPQAFDRFKALPHELGEPLWRYCYMQTTLSADPFCRVLGHHTNVSMAVFDDSTSPAAASILMVAHVDKGLLEQVMQLYINTPLAQLQNPLWAPQQVHRLVKQQPDWQVWSLSCASPYVCPNDQPFCCTATDGEGVVRAVVSRSIVPAPPSALRSSVSVVQHPRPWFSFSSTPNYYDTLAATHRLPSELCRFCLTRYYTLIIKDCLESCRQTFPRDLCLAKAEPKWVGEEWTVHPPILQRDPHRLIPRIVHQTDRHALDPLESRLSQSLQRSGWEYRFYTDEDIASFLEEHFPLSVKEAYDSLIPGAFKADLFRYCVLLIHGGLYADVDVLLETNLDDAIPPDVGFMVPRDEPGRSFDQQMCLWNGFLAAAPGHPYLAKTIELVVNQIRNRFTIMDILQTLCPVTQFEVVHDQDVLFVSGPCALGASVNRLLGRAPQSGFGLGTLNDTEVGLGKTVLLKQNLTDLGAHRMTNTEENRLVASTGLVNHNVFDDANHYVHSRSLDTYGVSGVYVDRQIRHENIVVRVERLDI